MDRRAFARCCAGLVAAWPWQLQAARAADYPTRPIQIVVPYAPGGATDTIARIIQQGIADRLGQPVMIVNRTGAGTIIGTQSVARATPDGYTLGLVSVPHVANYTLYREMPYAQSDFVPIMMLTNTPSILVVNPALPVNDLSDLIAYIRARPGAVNYATFGIGSSPHLAALQFEAQIGGRLVNVPYKGGAPASIGVMIGEVQILFASALSVSGGIESGKLKPIAVASRERMKIFPALPTFAEAGMPFTNGAWFGLLAPAGTPAPIVHRLHEVTLDVMMQPDVKETLENSGAELFLMDPDRFARFIADETRIWNRILSGISAERH